MKFRWIGTVGLVSALALTACGGGGGTTASPSPAAGGNGGGAAETLEVAGLDTLRFNPEALTLAAGQEATVAFENEGALQHNWVLVEPGQEQAAAGAADASGEIASDAPGVIVAGDVLDGGSSEEINVPALDAGEYTYICTVPGHLPGGMRGTLTVE